MTSPTPPLSPSRRSPRARAERTGRGAPEAGPDRDVDDDVVLAPKTSDLRLLVPALVAWATVAALLGGGTVSRSVVLGAVVVLGAWMVCWEVRVSRRAGEGSGPDTGGPPAFRAAGYGARAAALRRLGALTAVATATAVVALAGWSAVRDDGPLAELSAERAVVTVEATVASDPVLLGASSRPGGAPLVLVTLAVRSVVGRGFRTTVHDPVLVLGAANLLRLHWHEQIRLTGRLARPTDPADDVVAILSPRGDPVETAAPDLVARWAEHVRSSLRDATAGLPGDARGLLPGLVIGDTSRTPADLTAAMQATGLTHLSAVSGSNVSFVCAAGLALTRRLGLRRRWRPLAVLIVLLGFVVLVRPEPSVVRAAAMGVVGLLGLSTSRQRVGLPALAAAVLVLLCWDPWLARSFGFVLSTLATLGLLVLAAPWGEAISSRLPARLQVVGPALAIPLAAQVVCAPVIVLLQASVSVVGVVANLLAAPLVAPATVVGVGVAALSVVWPTGASWLAWVPGIATWAIARIARICAALPWGSIPWPSGAPAAWLLAGLSLLAVLTGPWVVHQTRRRPAVMFGCGVLGLAVALPTRPVTWPPAGWRYVMCDVGQGDGMVLRSAEGSVVVVDTGPDPAVMDGCLSRLHVGHVDAVVLTHDHADHVDGLPGVLHGRTVDAVLTDPVDDPPAQAHDVVGEAATANVPVTHLYAGDRLGWPGISARVWWPARVIHAGSVPNNASIVLTVDLDGLRLLLLGDVEHEAAAEVLTALRADGSELAQGFDVVKVAHHGSGNRDDALYQAVRAPVALISVGADNDYGHPAPSTVALLQHDGFEVLRTDQHGDIAVTQSPEGGVGVVTDQD